MVGIPGQTYASSPRDIELFRGMDMDMIGVGPYLPTRPRRWAGVERRLAATTGRRTRRRTAS